MNNIEKFGTQVCDGIYIFTASALYRMDIIEIKETRIAQTCVMKQIETIRQACKALARGCDSCCFVY